MAYVYKSKVSHLEDYIKEQHGIIEAKIKSLIFT